VLGEGLRYCENAAARLQGGNAWMSSQHAVEAAKASRRQLAVAPHNGFERCIELRLELQPSSNAAQLNDFATH
jgi:L-ascorbate metabolism protein UlaG (beta-lactamase superfamily)